MKKPQPKKRTRAPQPPAGLVSAFKLLSETSDNSGAAAALAAECYPYALQLIDAVNTTGGDDVGAIIERATKALHGHVWTKNDIATMPELTGDTALHIGFATCWLMMTTINGQGVR